MSLQIPLKLEESNMVNS